MLAMDFRVTVDQKHYRASGGQQQAMVIRDVCPRCKSPKYKKNGHIHSGKQNHQCCDCGRQFVQCFEQYLIAEDRRGLIERLLVERISLRGICRAVGGNSSGSWVF
jgi:transposase-like protein